MKLRHNPSINKETLETLADVFSRIFKINPEERISIEELQRYKFFTPMKSVGSISTES